MPRSNGVTHGDLLGDANYQAVAKYVSAVQHGPEGVIAEEIIRDLEIPRATVYRKLKMPGFYVTPRPIFPRGYGYDVKLASRLINEAKELPRVLGFSDAENIDIHLGRVTLQPTNPAGIKPVLHMGEFVRSTRNLTNKVDEVNKQYEDAKIRNHRFVNGDASAFDPKADMEFFKTFAALVSSCRLVAELGVDILKSDEMSQPDYWRQLEG